MVDELAKAGIDAAVHVLGSPGGLHLAQSIEGLIEGAPRYRFVAKELHQRVGAGTVVLESVAAGLARLHAALEDVGFLSGTPLGLGESPGPGIGR